MALLQQHSSKFLVIGVCAKSCKWNVVGVRPGTYSRPRLITKCVSASFDEVSIPSSSKCPFAGVSSAARVKLPAAELLKLQGPGWSVLPNGNTEQLPEPQAKSNWSPLQFVVGDFPEQQQKGEIPFLLERFRLFGPVFKFKFGSQPMVAVLEHDTVKSLLQYADSKAMAFWSPPALKPFMSAAGRKNMSNPAARMNQRKTLAPGFSRQAMRQVLSKIESICAKHLASWADSGRAIDLTNEGRELSFDFSTQLLVNFDVPEAERPAVKGKLDAMFKAMLSLPINLPGTAFTKGIQAKEELIEEIKHMIDSNSGSGSGSSAFELILQAIRENQAEGDELTAEQMAESGISLLLAGTDTSGGGVQATLAMLAMFPEVMDKLREEQQQVIAEHGTALTLNALDSMAYADSVIKEALRLAPPAGAVMRKTFVDLEIGGKFVPAGSTLYLSTFTAGNLSDPSLHPSGLNSLTPDDLKATASKWQKVNYNLLKDEFRPERWLKGNTEEAKSSGLMTFSVGPHVCLGMSLFMAEAKVLLAMLARGYELQPEAPAESEFGVMMIAQLVRNAGSRIKFVRLPVAVEAAAADRVPAAV